MKLLSRKQSNTNIGSDYETIELTWRIGLEQNEVSNFDRFRYVEVLQIIWPNSKIQPNHFLTQMRSQKTQWFSVDAKDSQKREVFEKVERFLIELDTHNPMIHTFKPTL